MSQYNKLSDIQYARLQILPVDLHFGLFGQLVFPPCVYITVILNDVTVHVPSILIANTTC